MKKLSTTFICILLLVTGCQKEHIDNKLQGDKWYLYSIQEVISGNITYPENNGLNRIYIEFMSSTVRFSGICNSGYGDYLTDGKSISINNISITKVGCGGTNWEEAVIDGLRMADRYETEHGRLYIYRENGNALVFTRHPH